MKDFLIKSALFSLPVIALFAFPFAVYLLSGEFLPPGLVLDEQLESRTEVLYDPAFTFATVIPYKTLGTERTGPAALAIGLSRTLTIRSIFFKDPASFYNAGSAVHIAPDLTAFMQQT